MEGSKTYFDLVKTDRIEKLRLTEELVHLT